jgi:cyclopropane-fatty-acyl-phospholipid synthase
VVDERFFERVLTGGEIGIGESYMDGEWRSPDLVALVQLMLANREVIGALPSMLQWPSRVVNAVAHRLRDNTRHGSRRNIHQHYDLGNDFFRLFLDHRLMYSCALFESPGDTLEQAQERKLHAICRQLDLTPYDHVLEIGTGWSGFAMFAHEHNGCRVTTTTISREQFAYTRQQLADAGIDGHAIDLRLEDYRDLRGRFDKIVSIEMFEAVGLEHYDEFFAACERMLLPHGAMLLQTITVDDWRFDEYRRTPSWIAKYIFPGSELAAVSRILESTARVTRLGLDSITQIGPHYAPTLREWRRRFHQRRADVEALGFDARFIRMWDLYLAYCEAAFASSHIGIAQLVLAGSETRARLARGERCVTV